MRHQLIPFQSIQQLSLSQNGLALIHPNSIFDDFLSTNSISNTLFLILFYFYLLTIETLYENFN